MAGPGTYASNASGLDLVAVTKSDSVPDPAGPFRAFRMDAEGAIKVTTAAGTDRTYPSGLFAAGEVVELQITRVWSTGTGSQNIYGYV